MEAMRQLAGRHQRVACPVSGCNQQISIKALRPNHALLRRMRRKMGHQ